MHSQLLHIILTRFNLPPEGRESKVRQSPNWLADRFELFECYCLPSLLAQSDSNFVWFLFFDIQTPTEFKERAKTLMEDNPCIKIFWVTSAPIEFIRECIFDANTNNATTLLTTRLDNDDSLNRDFVSKLHKVVTQEAMGSTPQVLNYDNGTVIKGNRVYSHEDKSNAFTSLVEPLNDSPHTIWRYQHTQLNRFGKIHHILDANMWLQVVHGANISNRIRGYRIDNRTLNEYFELNIKALEPDSKLSIFIENSLIYPLRLVKEFCRTLVKSLLRFVPKKT